MNVSGLLVLSKECDIGIIDFLSLQCSLSIFQTRVNTHDTALAQIKTKIIASVSSNYHRKQLTLKARSSLRRLISTVSTLPYCEQKTRISSRVASEGIPLKWMVRVSSSFLCSSVNSSTGTVLRTEVPSSLSSKTESSLPITFFLRASATTEMLSPARALSRLKVRSVSMSTHPSFSAIFSFRNLSFLKLASEK